MHNYRKFWKRPRHTADESKSPKPPPDTSRKKMQSAGGIVSTFSIDKIRGGSLGKRFGG